MISKVALLQYNAKSTNHDVEQWPEWTVDSLTHTVHKSGMLEVASRHASVHSYVHLEKSATFEITCFRTNHRESQPI